MRYAVQQGTVQQGTVQQGIVGDILMSKQEKDKTQFWGIFVTLLIVFGIISLISRMLPIGWIYQLLGTIIAATVATCVVVVIFRRLNRSPSIPVSQEPKKGRF
jgi:hypothetical protein